MLPKILHQYDNMITDHCLYVSKNFHSGNLLHGLIIFLSAGIVLPILINFERATYTVKQALLS